MGRMHFFRERGRSNYAVRVPRMPCATEQSPQIGQWLRATDELSDVVKKLLMRHALFYS